MLMLFIWILFISLYKQWQPAVIWHFTTDPNWLFGHGHTDLWVNSFFKI